MKNFTKFLLVIGLFLAPLLASAKTFDSNLYFGLTNNSDVQMLQEFLTDQGVYSGPITGNFFSLTLAAVKNYQSQNGITPAAGFFGPITRAKANEILLAQTQSSDSQAIAETGTIAPPITQNTTTDSNQQLMLSLQAQISLLLQQIAQMQQQGAQTPTQSVSQTPVQTTQTTQSQPTQTNSNTTTSAIRISIGGNNGAIANETSRTLYVGQTNQLAPTLVYPAGSTYSSFIWLSSDSTVASVSSGGLVTALKAGLTIITVTTTVNNSVTVSATDVITVLPSQTQSTQTNSTQTTDLQISSIQIKTDTYSAVIEWQTNKPATSKVFISADNISTKVVPSESGLSSRHIANIMGLLPDKNYSYEIEAIANNVSIKKSGEFKIPLKPAYTKDQWMISFLTAGGEDYIKRAKLTNLFWDDITKNWVDSAKIDYEVGEWMMIAQYNSELNGWFVTENGKIKGLQPKGLDRNSEYADRWGHLTIGYPSEWQIRTGDQAVKGLTWNFYVNNILLGNTTNSSNEHLSNPNIVTGARNGKIPLQPNSTCTYKIIAKEQGRENSIYEGTFTTGTREFMERYDWPIGN